MVNHWNLGNGRDTVRKNVTGGDIIFFLCNGGCCSSGDGVLNKVGRGVVVNDPGGGDCSDPGGGDCSEPGGGDCSDGDSAAVHPSIGSNGGFVSNHGNGDIGLDRI